MTEATKVECPRAVPPCTCSFEAPTRYEAQLKLAAHLEVVHGIWSWEATRLALTAPEAAS